MDRPPPGRGCGVMAASWAVAMAADDGQAEAVAAVAAGWARAEPLEGLEQAADLGERDDLPGVGHRQDGVAVAGPGGDLDVPARDVVMNGVVDQVGHQLLNEEGVTVEDGGLDAGVDVQAEAADPGRGTARAALVMAARSSELALAEAGFAAGQGEQRLDEAFLLGVEGEQVPADVLPGGGGGGRVGAGDLEQGAFPGQRRAQLVRGVGGEAPLGVERRLQPREQAVEGVAEFLELVVGPVRASRSCRLVAEIRRAAAVIVLSGRSTRPASSQPAPTAVADTMTRAMPDRVSSSRLSMAICSIPFCG